MRICTAQLKSMTAYSQSAMHETPFLSKESHDAWDERTWREKSTTNESGIVCIPAMALKMALDESIKRLGIKVEGRRGATYAKYFLAGQICAGDVPIGVAKSDLQSIKIWANADGVRGSGKRVKRRFPIIHQWTGTAEFHVLDDMIPPPIFEQALEGAGKLIGIGRFRPEKGGFLGRFVVTSTKWAEE